MVSRSENCNRLNAKRAITVRTLKQSEKAITDSQRIKQDVEAAKAAGMWTKGMERERDAQ